MSPTLAERGLVLHPFPVEYRLADPDNFGVRKASLPDTIVLHTTESRRNAAALTAGKLPSAVYWFQDPKAKASAHFVVGTDGAIYATVPEGCCAWHAGNKAVNDRSIGIEVEGFAGEPETWNPDAWAALVTLCADLCRRHSIPVVHQAGPGICGHSDVPDPKHPDLRGGANHHKDPGPHLNFSDLLDAIRAELAAEGVA